MERTREQRHRRWLWRSALASTLGIPVFVVLHNAFDALSIFSDRVPPLSAAFNVLSVVYFFLALIMIPATGVLLTAAITYRLTAGWNAMARRVVLVLVPVAAAVAVVTLSPVFRGISRIERDTDAGLNGSFETVRSAAPVNWHVYRSPLEDDRGELTFDKIDFHDGRQSLKLVAHRVTGRTRGPGLFQVVDATKGQTYTVRFWLKSEDASVRLIINSETAESRDPRNPIRVEIPPSKVDADQWHEVAYSYTVPDGYRNIRFEIYMLTPGTVWIDDVRIEPIDDSSMG